MVWSLPVVAVLFFAIGFAAGFYMAGILDDATTEEVRLYMGLFVTLVWGTSVAAGIILGDAHSPSWGLHAIMGAVAGFFFKTANPVDKVRGDDS